MLYREYGGEEGLGKDGLSKVKEARSMLKAIRNEDIILLDSNGDELTLVVQESIDGWPDSTTKDADDEDAGGDVKFRISKQF